MTPDSGLIWIAIGLATAVCYAWRFLGVAVSGGLKTDSPIIRWVTYVTYAMLAGTFTRMILLPAGELANVPLDKRLVAFAFAVVLFFLVRRHVFTGTCAGVVGLIGLNYWAGFPGFWG